MIFVVLVIRGNYKLTIMKKQVSSRHYMDLLGIAILQVLILSSNAMKYKDPLTSGDLANMFNEDGCIEGTLSMLDLGSPIPEPISIIESSMDERNKTYAFGGKTPMSLLHELATYNNIQYQYDLTGEEGLAHSKKFVIVLKVGEESYVAEGASIKKAQHEAAKLALNSTLYEHPPVKNPVYTKPTRLQKTPEEKLNEWAKKHGHAIITYSFNEQTRLHHHDNQYHKGMYSKAQNVHKVIVKVLNQEFAGEGPSSDAAKHNAANNALNKLQKSEAFCMFDDGVKKLFKKIFTDSTDSPISLVYQFGSKSKMETSFDLVSEEGPAHIKKFVYKCKVGDGFEALGEGSSKKEAKRDAAEAMIEHLKSSIPYDTQCVNIETKKSKKKTKNLVKSVVKSYEDEFLSDDRDMSSIKDEMNPISKLYHLQQVKHHDEPIFKLVEENGYPNKEFLIEVAVGEISFIGSGPSKKTAKKKAAEGMLEKLGYSSKSGSTRISDKDNKKTEFQLDPPYLNKKSLIPGMNLKSDKFTKLDEPNEMPVTNVKPNSYESSNKINQVHVKSQHDDHKQHRNIHSDDVQHDSNVRKFGSNAKGELKKMADQMRIRFQFSDFPKTNNKGFVSLISLTTDPPIICYGVGLTTDHSQDKAALTALSSLYKSQLNTITKMLQDPSEKSVKEELSMIDKETVINYVIPKKAE